MNEDERRAVADRFIDELREMRQRIIAAVPPGREQSCVLTKLDEASMWLEATVTGSPLIRRKTS